jgi:hypothetical protein
MASLTKSKTPTQRQWRPDFRDTQTLPDTKVIRTGFLLNFVGIAAAVICLTLYGIREYTLQNLIKNLDNLSNEVSSATAENRKILDTNKKFRQSAEIVIEAVAFDTEPVSYHSFLSQLGDALQEGMKLEKIQLSGSSDTPEKGNIPPFKISMDGRVLENAPGTPAQVLSRFQDAMLGLSCLEEKQVEMEMVRFNRNNEFGHFDFTLLIKIAVEKVPSL